MHVLTAEFVEISSPCLIVFSDECETSKIPTIFTLTYILWVFCRNWLPHYQISFLSFLGLHATLSQEPISTLSLKNIDEVQRCSELLYWNGLCHHVCWILLYTDFHQINNIFHCNPLMYPMIPHIDVLYPPVIHVIFSEMYCQCFKYRISTIYQSTKLYTGSWIPGDISRYDTKYLLIY